MRVLLTSHGSTGDIYPVIAFGRALLEAGHEVRFATAPLYREEIESAGLAFVHLPPDWNQNLFAECMRELEEQPNPLMLLRKIYRDGLPFLEDLISMLEDAIKESDVLVSSYLFPHYRILAERNHKPFAILSFCHQFVPNVDRPPPDVPRLRFMTRKSRIRWNELTWALVDMIISWNINDVIGPVLQRNKIPLVKTFFTNPAKLSLVGVSRELMQPDGAPDNYRFTGYLRWQAKHDPKMEAILEDFCAGEEVPVLNFGSVNFDDVHGKMGRFLKHWPRDKKIIIQSGWAGLSLDLERPNIKVIGKMSHDQLFRFASCVIHHGGAGTTASVLYSGKPNIIVPHFGDQYFWAREIKRLGAGTRVRKSRWPEKVHSAVLRVEQNSAMRANTERLAKTLQQESGRSEAVRLLENFVAAEGGPLA